MVTVMIINRVKLKFFRLLAKFLRFLDYAAIHKFRTFTHLQFFSLIRGILAIVTISRFFLKSLSTFQPTR